MIWYNGFSDITSLKIEFQNRASPMKVIRIKNKIVYYPYKPIVYNLRSLYVNQTDVYFWSYFLLGTLQSTDYYFHTHKFKFAANKREFNPPIPTKLAKLWYQQNKLNYKFSALFS